MKNKNCIRFRTVKLDIMSMSLLLCLILFNVACTNTIQIRNSFFVLPLDKKFLPLKYADTGDKYKGYYVLNTNDTVFYNIFYNVHPLSEECPELQKVSTSITTKIEGEDTVHIWSGYTNYDRDVNRHQNIYYFFSEELTVDYKITVPIDSNRTGLFGIFVDSFYVSGNNIPPLQMNVFIEHPQKGSYKELYNLFQNFSFIPLDEKIFRMPDPSIPH